MGAANGERFQAMVLQGWGTFVKERRARLEKKQQRTQDLLQRIRMEGEGLMVTVIRCWIDDTHEALRAKGKAKEGKEEKKRAAIAKFAANGERFQAMVLQSWREVVERKRARETKKQERVQDLMKRMAMKADNLMIFIVRLWIDDTDEERRAKFSKKAGKEEKKAAAMARIASNGERFQAMVLQAWHQRASAVKQKKQKKD